MRASSASRWVLKPPLLCWCRLPVGPGHVEVVRVGRAAPLHVRLAVAADLAPRSVSAIVGLLRQVASRRCLRCLPVLELHAPASMQRRSASPRTCRADFIDDGRASRPRRATSNASCASVSSLAAMSRRKNSSTRIAIKPISPGAPKTTSISSASGMPKSGPSGEASLDRSVRLRSAEEAGRRSRPAPRNSARTRRSRRRVN